MAENLAQRTNEIADHFVRRSMRFMFSYLYDTISSVLLQSGALAINGAGNAAVKIGAAIYATAQGVLVTKAANTVMAALVGTVTNAKFNVFCFFIDSAGVLTSSMGTQGATLGAVLWPVIPPNKAMIGFVIINPTGAGNFVGGTTALDDAGVVPNAVYINTLAGFDPTAVYSS